jgi:hypothetical protein
MTERLSLPRPRLRRLGRAWHSRMLHQRVRPYRRPVVVSW